MSTQKKAPKAGMEDVQAALQALIAQGKKDGMIRATDLHAQLEKNDPGICRFLSFRQERFNQDLSTGAMLIEVGAAGDTLPQALRATEYLAQAIVQLARGTGEGSEN